MYLEHFGLKAFPFSTAPDPRFYYPSAKHREALACLLYSIQQRKGFALITGEVGSGKSMLCRAARQRLSDGVHVAMVTHTSLSADEFILAVVAEFGVRSQERAKIQMVNAFRNYLGEMHRQGRTVVLIVDEAQDLSPEALEEVRLLGNMETATDKLLQIILVGQPELRHLIGTHQFRQLDQRITVKFHLGTLCYRDVDAYIDHRLQVAGAEEPGLFDADAKFEVFKASGGVPRLINVTCDQALLQAYVQEERAISVDIIRRVVAERDGYYMNRTGEVMSEAVRQPPARDNLVMRKVRVKCPQCKATVSVYEDEAGQSGICPGCGAVLKIPVNVFGKQTQQPDTEQAETRGGRKPFGAAPRRASPRR